MSDDSPVAASSVDPIDVVYVFRRVHNKPTDDELFYSLRSVKKNLQGYRKIWIVGESPRFEYEVGVPFEVIPMEDKFKTSLHNVRAKLLKAAGDERIAKDFVFMNDDFFFLSDCVAGAIPFFRQGTIPQHIEWRSEQTESPYVRALMATQAALEKQNLPVTDFECHTPILFEKDLLLPILDDSTFDWAVTYGMVFRSLYCNALKMKGERCMDLKIDSPLGDTELDRCFAACRFLSTGPGGLNESMMRHFAKSFPFS